MSGSLRMATSSMFTPSALRIRSARPITSSPHGYRGSRRQRRCVRYGARPSALESGGSPPQARGQNLRSPPAPTPAASGSPAAKSLSSVFLLKSSVGLSPRGSSPRFRKSFRRSSIKSWNASMVIRSPRNPHRHGFRGYNCRLRLKEGACRHGRLGPEGRLSDRP
jgi:hypothetical protein